MSDWMELVDPGAPGATGPAGPAGPPGVAGPTGPPGGLQWFNVLDASFAGGAVRAPLPPPLWDIPVGFTSDSTAAFAAANAAAHAAGGGVIYAPYGFYIADIFLSPFVWLVGDGWAQSIIHAKPTKTSGGICETIPQQARVTPPTFTEAGGYLGGCKDIMFRGNNPFITRPDGHYGNGSQGSFGGTPNDSESGEDGLSLMSNGSGASSGGAYAFGTVGVALVGCTRDGYHVAGVGEVFSSRMWVAGNGRYGVLAGSLDSQYEHIVSGSNGVAGFLLPSGINPDLTGSIDNQFVHCSGTDSERADWIISGLINRLVGCEAQNSPIGYELIGGDETSTKGTGNSGTCVGNVLAACTALGNKEPVVLDGTQFAPGGPTLRDNDIDVTAYPANSSWALTSLVTIKGDAGSIGKGNRIRVKAGRGGTTTPHATPTAPQAAAGATGSQAAPNDGLAPNFSAVAFGTSRDGFHTGSLGAIDDMAITVGGLEGKRFFNPTPSSLPLDVLDGFSELQCQLQTIVSIPNPVHHGAILPGHKVRFIFVQDGAGGHTISWGSAFLSNVQPRPDPYSVTTIDLVNVSPSMAPLWAVGGYIESFSTTPTPIDPGTLSGLIQWNKLPIVGAVDNAAIVAWPAEVGHGINLTAPAGSNPPFFHSTGPHLINGHPCLRFVTADTGEITTALVGAHSPVVNQPLTAIIVARIDGSYSPNANGYDTILDSPDSSAAVPAIPPNRIFISGVRVGATTGPTADPQLNNWGLDAGTNAESATPSDTAAHIFEAVVDAGAGRLTIDGGEVLSGDVGLGKWSGVQLGLHGAGQYEVSVLVGEVLVFDRLLTNTEINGVRAWLAAEFTVPVVFPGTYTQAGP